MQLTAGPHVIGAAFVARSDAINPTRLQPFIRSSTDTRDTSGHPHFDTFTVTGPFNATGPGRHAEPPPDLHAAVRATRAEEDPCAQQIIATLARRAYRGDVTDVDLAAPARRSIEAGREAGHLRDAASRWRCSACWPARSSAFHVERDPAGARAAARCIASAISSWRRACRSSSGAASPTTQLLDVAAQGKLHTPAVLEQQVRRMLADPKAEALDDQLRRAVAVPAQPEEHAAELGGVPRLRRQPAAGLRARDRRCSSRASCAKTATSST